MDSCNFQLSMNMNISSFLNYVPFFAGRTIPRSDATAIDNQHLTACGVSSGSPAARSTRSDRQRLGKLTTLLPELQKEVAQFLSLESLKELASVDQTLSQVAKAAIRQVGLHVRANTPDELDAALAAHQGYRITKITLGNADDPGSGAAAFRDEHLAFMRELPLESVNLSGCRQLSDAVLSHLPASVTAVDLSWCGRITDAGLARLPAAVKTVNLSGCVLITDAGMENIPRGVTALDVSGCFQFTNDGLANVPRNLLTLNVHGCFMISDEGLEHIPASATSVNLSGCDDISREGIDALQVRLPLGSDIIIDDGPRQDDRITLFAWPAP